MPKRRAARKSKATNYQFFLMGSTCGKKSQMELAGNSAGYATLSNAKEANVSHDGYGDRYKSVYVVQIVATGSNMTTVWDDKK